MGQLLTTIAESQVGTAIAEGAAATSNFIAPVLTPTKDFIGGLAGTAEKTVAAVPEVAPTFSLGTGVPLTEGVAAIPATYSTAAKLGQATTGLAKIAELGTTIAGAAGAFAPDVPGSRSLQLGSAARVAAEREEQRRAESSRSRLAPTGSRNRSTGAPRTSLGSRNA